MIVGYVIASYGDPQQAEAATRSILAFGTRLDRIVIETDPNGTGYSATLNRGIAQLPRDVDVVCCLNSDVEKVLGDGVIGELFEDPLVAIIGPRQITADRLVAHGGLVPDEDDGGTVWDLDLRHRYWLAPLDREDVREGTDGTLAVPTVPGSVFYIRRHVLDVLGGWPEWTRFYYEDTWLCYLARLYGWRVLYTGATTWVHYGQQGAPLDRQARLDRMAVARERFCFEAGRAGIPLRFSGALV